MLMYNHNQITAKLPDFQEKQLLMLCSQSFWEDSSDVVASVFAH